jgi:hypothetical protein
LNHVARVAEAGADALGRTVLQRGFRSLDENARGRPAGPHDDAGALIGDVVLLQPGIGDGLFHGDMVPRATAREEAHGAAVDQFGRIERRRTPDLGAEAVFGEGIGKADAGSGIAKRGRDLIGVVADGGYDAEAGDNDASHGVLLDGRLDPWRIRPLLP